jgi:hypothetical protein
MHPTRIHRIYRFAIVGSDALMGLRNVIAAIGTYPGKLSPEVRMTLVTMAAIAYDEPQHGLPASTYFGGWVMCAARQGLYPDETQKRRFIVHVAILRKVGLVETLAPGGRGKNAIYRLTLPVENLPVSVDNLENNVD